MNPFSCRSELVFSEKRTEEQCAFFPLNSLSLTTVLTASLSSLWEPQIPGKLRKKRYVRGSLLSSQIGFNFLLARVAVPRDCTTCCVWAESRRGGICFPLGVFSTQDAIRREQTIQHLSWRRQKSNVSEIFFRWRQSPSCMQRSVHLSQTNAERAVYRCSPRPRLLSAGLQSLGRQTSLQLSQELAFRGERGRVVCKPYNIARFGSTWACLIAICKLKPLTQKGNFVLPGFVISWIAWYNYPKINMPWAELYKHKTVENAANIFLAGGDVSVRLCPGPPQPHICIPCSSCTIPAESCSAN